MSIPDDFTFYPDRNATLPTLKSALGEPATQRGGTHAARHETDSHACTLQFPMAEGGAEPVSLTARALVCSCFGGQHLSVTCRTLNTGATGQAQQATVSWPTEPVSLLPSGQSVPPEQEDSLIARSTRELMNALWKMLPLSDPTRPLTGLIVIAGRTGSGKSVIARAFTEKYMQHCVGQGPERRPHLLTYEDPIEKPFAASPLDAAARGYDYTPREKAVDVDCLAEAARDALRQTPALFYVGETRDDDDWRALLNFAGTGHLAITTGHAGSLVETMAQIIQANRARTPAQRSRVAGRLAALVHIRAHTPESKTPRKVLVPAFWIRTPRAISAFTAEGMGSMLANRPGDRAESPGSYGRAYAVERLEYLRAIPELQARAVEWDLRGE